MQKRTCSEMKFQKLDYSLQATNIAQERRVKHFSTFNIKCKNSQLLTENSKNGISQTISQTNVEQKHLIESNNKIIKCVDRKIQLEQMTKNYIPNLIIYTQYFYGKIKEILQKEKNNKQIYEACVQVLHQIHALVTQHQSESIIKVKQLKFNKFDKKYTVALDLDETLIHSEEYQFNKQYDFTNYKFGVYFRPFYQQFLERLAFCADIFIYTTAKKHYAKIIIDAIDPQRKYIKRVLALEDCLYSQTGKFLIKDISIINNDLTKTFLIDNNPQSFIAQPQNGIPIVPFFDNKDDKELMILLAFIEKEIFTKDSFNLSNLDSLKMECKHILHYMIDDFQINYNNQIIEGIFFKAPNFLQCYCSAYGKNSLRRKNIDKRKLATIFFPNKWNFFYFFNMLKDCKQFIFACISKIDHSWIIKLLVELAKQNRKIYIIMNCKDHQKNDPTFQSVICELLIESQFKIKITVNVNNFEILPTNFCIIDGTTLITSSADWTINSFIKHEWMMIDRNYDNIIEMIEVFEMLWIQYQFITFVNEDLALISSDEPQFEKIFSDFNKSNQNPK